MGARLIQRATGAIIAGGSATRLGGVAKGLLDIGGVRIIDRVARALAPVVHASLIASNAPDAATWIPGVRAVPDVLTGGGSAAGIHAALQAAGEPIVAVAWDMPFVTAELLVLIAARGDVSVVDAVVCRGPQPGTLEPLCAWYAPACAAAIERGWQGGERSLHALLSRVRTVIVSRAEAESCGPLEELFFNVNTARELELAREMAGQRADGKTR